MEALDKAHYECARLLYKHIKTMGKKARATAKSHRELDKEYMLFIAAMFGKGKLAYSSFKHDIADLKKELHCGTPIHYCCTIGPDSEKIVSYVID